MTIAHIPGCSSELLGRGCVCASGQEGIPVPMPACLQRSPGWGRADSLGTGLPTSSTRDWFQLREFKGSWDALPAMALNPFSGVPWQHPGGGPCWAGGLSFFGR